MRGKDLISLPGRLVRDHIPELARRARAGLIFDQARQDQIERLMVEKIIEEASELLDADTKDEALDRLAAVFELTERLARRWHYNFDQVVDRAHVLELDKGPFRLGIILVGRTIENKETDRG
jgi:predicted house-cleaning noncanonical NTP pyrophosphatase (MazG superfamily)